ncbi:MAG: hypothetical protein J0I99_11890 [Devosia sp.]|uniref:hypothetical protein n=1 Tax=Devosia sp. TaxID=1871048 RepID=UPI001AC03B7E|nr:hypothetical protein [Devosia sp.]MBN9310790.1 hypothetical protein [Devosia sp.]MBN9316435.1 hypothetical protein [Devosia sp.]
MSPTKLPAPRKTPLLPRRRLFGNPLTAAAAISFSLTFLGAGALLAAGVVPPRVLTGLGEIDTPVVFLLVPLCALLFAIMVEVVRATLREGPHRQPRPPRQPNALAAWKPGTGEG